MAQDRFEAMKKNVAFSYVSNVVNTIASFVLRTIFIKILSADYLGVNALFTDVLNLLSFAELGIGNAMNFALYKPVAENDKEKIKSLMAFYKKAYFIIALVIAALGLALLPFLDYLINNPNNIEHIKLYYLIYLYNTVVTYFVSYKHSIVNAEQKNYLVSVVNSISTIFTYVVQIIALLIFRNYIVYLISASLALTIRLFIESKYWDKQYPILKEKDIKEMDKDDLASINKNVRGLIVHKVSDVLVTQTDTILISMFSNLAVLGMISNYKTIMNSVSSIILTIFTSTTSTLGNIVATESKEKQLYYFNFYNFVDFWIYGFSSLAFYFLLKPSIIILWGSEYVIDQSYIFVICLNFYLTAQIMSYANFKAANGSFVDDRYFELFCSIFNLVVSVLLVKTIGLIGIYIGTTITYTLSLIVRPKISYENFTSGKLKDFYINLLKYISTVGLCFIILQLLFNLLNLDYSWLSYFIRIIIVAIVPNVIIFFLYRKREEEKYLFTIIKERLVVGKIIKKSK